MNFPSTPNLGEQYSLGDYTWQWNGKGWEVAYRSGVGGFLVFVGKMYRLDQLGTFPQAVSFDIT